MRKLLCIGLMALLPAAAAGCGDSGSSAKPPPAPVKAAKPAARGATVSVKVLRTRYGRILVDGRGRALYLFTREATTRARCYGACARAWPVFFAKGPVRAGSEAQAGLVGTTTRLDGRRQVTYNGHPLYYYVTDRAPGQVTCQNVAEYGGTWLVVAPSGAAIR